MPVITDTWRCRRCGVVNRYREFCTGCGVQRSPDSAEYFPDLPAPPPPGWHTPAAPGVAGPAAGPGVAGPGGAGPGVAGPGSGPAVLVTAGVVVLIAALVAIAAVPGPVHRLMFGSNRPALTPAGARAAVALAQLTPSDLGPDWTLLGQSGGSGGDLVPGSGNPSGGAVGVGNLGPCMTAQGAGSGSTGPGQASVAAFGGRSGLVMSALVVGTERSTEPAHAALLRLADRSFATCLLKGLVASLSRLGLPDGVTVGAGTISPLVRPDLGNEATAVRVEAPVQGSVLAINIYLDVYAARRGHALAVLITSSAHSPLPGGQAYGLLQDVVGRLPADI